MEEVSKFLSEAMGECWHESNRQPNDRAGFPATCSCGHRPMKAPVMGEKSHCQNNDFSTWIGFGKLWNWGTHQEWWIDFVTEYGFMEFIEYIDPDKLANAIYEYLQNKV